MASWVKINIGSKNWAIKADFLPPVGTILRVHKHLTEEGNAARIEVVSHDWSLEEDFNEDDPGVTFPKIEVRVLTKLVK